jgi:hypothetical protein
VLKPEPLPTGSPKGLFRPVAGQYLASFLPHRNSGEGGLGLFKVQVCHIRPGCPAKTAKLLIFEMFNSQAQVQNFTLVFVCPYSEKQEGRDVFSMTSLQWNALSRPY